MRRLGSSLLAVFGLMLAMSWSALADAPVTYTLNQYETGGAVPTADLILVTVTTGVTSASCPHSQTTCVTVSFTPDTAMGSTLTTIDAPVYINVNGAFYCNSNDGGCTAEGGGLNLGQMSLGTGASHLADVIIYLVPNGSNGWTDTSGAADVLTPTCPGNDSQPSCVGGYGVPNPDTSGGYNTGLFNHGFVAEVEGATPQVGVYGASSVPEPTAVILFGSVVLLVIGAVRRKLAQS